MELNEVRSKYLEFFKARGHNVIPSSSLVPENDPTTLFTGSGMQPLVPYLLGKNHPAGNRLVDSQKCFRSMDIEEVGDNRHTTFFEMLGNWSLGDYFKKEQLAWVYEFFTEEISIPKEKLWVTCFEGDETLNLPKDTESAEIWESLGMPKDHIRFYDAKKNWWSRAGVPQNMPAGEPGGPDSEIFYEFTDIVHDTRFGPECHPNCDCGRFLEIGNSVFMQYIKKEDGSFALLPKQNVDFGGGLERITAAVNNSADVFPTAHRPIIEYLEARSEKKYTGEKVFSNSAEYQNTRMFRIIADHVKAAVFLIGDNVRPGNTDQGYYVRRLIRRAVRYADRIGIAQSSFAKIVRPVAEMYQDQYPELMEQIDEIESVIAGEEEKFRKTLARGMKELERFIGTGNLSAQDAFQLVTTYGFPLELIIEEAGEKGIKQIDIDGFKELLKQHQDLSRSGSEQKFKGGLADTSEKTTRLHTAHHLLLKALQQVLGPQVHQRGSNITQERLRIDFSWDAKMTEEQKKEVEQIVNEKIKEDLPVIRNEMAKEEAEKLGAEHEFGAKYPDRVSVYSVGPLESAFSIEFCGGPHVERTGELALSTDPSTPLGAKFKILKEEAVSAGIRRIKAVLE
ncbi:MAG: Alanine--tRNA ligase [Parcubacteria group bacterium Gr01-1014_56]|nr:MAG: Alanine--tRNA ligase [Parcubacteria group bacterium Gr01-1014_56]